MFQIDKIKTLYDEYKQGENNQLSILKELVKLFNISLNENEVANCDIKSFDYKTLAIEIINKKDNTIYMASYTSDADFLNFLMDKLQFIKVSSFNQHRKIENLYFVDDKRPIISKITFSNGEYELIFEQEMPNSIGSIRDGMKMSVIYVKNIIINGKEVQQILLNKKYVTSYLTEQSDNSFEKIFTYYTFGSYSYIYPENHSDKYIYKRNNNIIYGINDLRQPNICNYLRGICIENSKDSIKDFFPPKMFATNYPMLFKERIISAMIFECKTDDDICYFLEIYKGDTIKIIYHSKKRFYKSGSKELSITSNEYELPVIFKGMIESEEIEKIINLLKIKFSNKKLVDIISNELNIFKSKLDKKREKDIEQDPLSPKLLINKSISEISEKVTANLEFYFDLAEEQFKEITNTSIENSKIQSKILKPYNNSQTIL